MFLNKNIHIIILILQNTYIIYLFSGKINYINK